MGKISNEKKFNYVGKPIVKVDGRALVTGSARYAIDFISFGMVHAVCLYAPSAHARICKLDTAPARRLPGILDVVTAEDLPGSKCWEKQQVLADKWIRYHGEAVAIVAAEQEATAQEALSHICLELEELPVLSGAAQAVAGTQCFFEERSDNLVEGSRWTVHKSEKDAPEGIIKLERTYRTQYVEHMYIEPEAVLVIPEEGGVTVIASAQGIYLVQAAVAAALGISQNRVRMLQPYVGGSFGGKNEGIGILAARAAVMAWRLGRPVRMRMSREESVRVSSKRHPMELHYSASLDQYGRLCSMKAHILAEGGAYATMTPYVNWRGCVHACGCYHIPRTDVEIAGYYTNRSMSGAFRGFSSPQIIFAQESLMDELAEQLGITPLELRRRNVLRNGELSATAQPIEAQVLPLEALLDLSERYTGYSRKYETFRQQKGEGWRSGIGLALSYRGCGYGAETADATGAYVIMHKDGSVTLRSALVDIGQGLHTAFCQILADTLGVRLEEVRMERADTTALPDGNFTSASRGTFRGGKAVMKAAEQLRDRLLQFAAGQTRRGRETLYCSQGQVRSSQEENFALPLSELATAAYYGGVDLSSWYWLPAEGVAWDYEAGCGNAYLTYACSVVVTELAVHTQTGAVRLEHVFACHDVGRAINPTLAKSQISGGIAMGVGMALKEEVKYKDARVLNGSFHDYIIPTALDLPPYEILLYEDDDPYGPYHAKSLGEACSEAVAASVANAVANAAGTRFYQLPITQEQLLLHFHERKG